MNDIAKDYLNEEDFFAYRYMPRLINDAGPKEIASFFFLSPKFLYYTTVARKFSEFDQ